MCMYVHGHGFSKVRVEGVQRLCSWVRGMGAPRFLCVVVPVSCRGGWLEWVILIAGGLSRVITIDLSMDGRVSQGGSKCRLVLPHTLQVSLCSGLPSWLFVGACQSWWWVLVASGPSSLFVNGGVGHLWTFMGSHRCSLIVVVDPCSQSSMVVVGTHCVSWGLPEESMVVMCDIMFITSPNWDVSNSVAFLSFVTLCQG